MTRTILPHRRRNETVTIEYWGSEFHVTVGFDASGTPREVFATGPKEGSDMQHVLSDACVVVSIALQHDVPAAELRKSLGLVPGLHGDEPASPIGAVLAVVAHAGLPRLDGAA